MATAVITGFKVFKQLKAVAVIDIKQQYQHQLSVHPATGGKPGRTISKNQHNAENEGKNSERRDKIQQSPFHDAELLVDSWFCIHCVINKQAWQIKNASEPGNHKVNVQGFNP